MMPKIVGLMPLLLFLPTSLLLAKGKLETLLLQLDKEIANKHFYYFFSPAAGLLIFD
ncbi:MAG: hypothetical protein LBT49_00380 [Prevotellaceae bacterium]|jgi:hypothetical protein|nr:hypothetical protein [Prevotellaceae bacterium]